MRVRPPTQIEHELLGDILRRERRRAGIKQVEVATKLGVPQSFVSKYEAGDRRLDVIEFLIIAKLVGFDPKVILDEIISSAPLVSRQD